MSEQLPAKTPWEFRLRAFFIAIAFGLGFFLGYPIQAALFHDIDPTFVVLGERWGSSGIYALAWIAAGITIVAWLIRLWGSSYHASGVVMSGDVATNTLTVAGPYRYVRNPLYLGNILLAVGIGSLGPPVATFLVVALNVWFVYRLIGIEERFLRTAFGTAYEQYCAAVPRLFPRFTPAPQPSDPRKPNFAYGFLTELFSLGFAAAMVYFAISIPYGGGRNIGVAFWSIAVFAIVLQMILSSAARRAGGQIS